MTRNFDFLSSEFPALASYGNQADGYRLDDPNSALIKVGMIGESIVNLIYDYTGTPLPDDGKAVSKINKLSREGYLPDQVTNLLHEMRKARNRAVHEGFESVGLAKTLVRVAHSICLWFAMSFGTQRYGLVKYVDAVAETSPADEPAPQTAADDARLEREASERAKAAPRVPKAELVKRAIEAENQRPKTEAETRLIVDSSLRAVGWEADTQEIRHSKGARPQMGRNLAIAEWPTDSALGGGGFADYALFVGERLVAVVEAKAESKDIPAVLDVQCKEYSSHIRQGDRRYCIDTFSGKYQVPFTFATNGRPYLKQYEQKSGIWQLDLRDPSNPPKALSGWPSPEGILGALKADIAAANRRLEAEPDDLLTDRDGLNLRDYQIRAVKAAERAVISGRRTALIAMATGTGKTRTALAMIYRFLKTDRFKRILFLVDRDALGEQAEDSFKDVKIDQLLTLNQIYEVKGLDSADINPETRVSIATVQSMVKRVFYGEDEQRKPSVTDYDLVIVDEAHRGYTLDKEMTDEEALYRNQREYQSQYRAIIEYFDAVKIAFTATPALHTTQIFGTPVFQYTYREAVIDGWLVDHDVPHTLTTRLSEGGIRIAAGETVAIYDPTTNELLNGAQLEDELSFDVEDFNRRVVDENFDRAVLEEIAKDIDPEAPEEQGKTLIYAVDDAHADLIVRLLKEIYSETGVDNDAIMKITAAAGGGSRKRLRELVRRFKNERFPSIAVTVDLLTTGIDVPEITTLVFMRRVKSRILFEQMLGRATRLCPAIYKTHFEIYDPVGVYEALQPVTSMRPVAANPSTTIGQLIEGLDYAENDSAVQLQIDRLVSKLRRKVRAMNADQKEATERLAGFSFEDFIRSLGELPPREAKERAKQQREILATLDEVHANGKHGVVITDKPDELIGHTRDYGGGVAPEDYLEAFGEYVRTNVNEVAALNLCVTKPSDLTRETLRELELTLSREGYTETRLNRAISDMANQEMTADIISLVRRYAIGSPLVSHEERIHRAVQRLRDTHDFSKQELTWLSRIEVYLEYDSVLNTSVFDTDERFKSKGGFKKIDKVFHGELANVVVELNTYLYDDKERAA